MGSLIVFCLLVASTLAKNLPSSDEVKIDPNVDWRVIGGENAPDGEFPHMISIRSYGGSHRCGGGIIHEEWVVTAGHCVSSGDPNSYKVIAGSNKLTGDDGDVYRVLEIYVHEHYDIEKFVHDIAILKVEKIKFTKKVNKIELEKTFVGGDVSVTLSGWGAISLGGPLPDVLQQLTYNTTTVEECKKRVSGWPMRIGDTHVCTLHRSGIGGCHGDSGSPLIRSVDGVRHVVGVVSGGPECGSGYYPDIFSRISAYVSWINSKCNCNL